MTTNNGFDRTIFPNNLAVDNSKTVKSVVFFVMVHMGIISRKLTRQSMKSQNTDCRMSYISIVCTLSLSLHAKSETRKPFTESSTLAKVSYVTV